MIDTGEYIMAAFSLMVVGVALSYLGYMFAKFVMENVMQ